MKTTQLFAVSSLMLLGYQPALASASGDYGAYRCTVEAVYREPDNGIARVYEDGILLFDSLTGSLDGSFFPVDILGVGVKKERTPFANIRSDFVVATPPSATEGLAAVAVPTPLVGATQPSISWFKLSPDGKTFKLFSTWIEALVVGTCERLR